MQCGKWKKCLFLAMAMVMVTINCRAADLPRRISLMAKSPSSVSGQKIKQYAWNFANADLLGNWDGTWEGLYEIGGVLMYHWNDQWPNDQHSSTAKFYVWSDDPAARIVLRYCSLLGLNYSMGGLNGTLHGNLNIDLEPMGLALQLALLKNVIGNVGSEAAKEAALRELSDQIKNDWVRTGGKFFEYFYDTKLAVKYMSQALRIFQIKDLISTGFTDALIDLKDHLYIYRIQGDSSSAGEMICKSLSGGRGLCWAPVSASNESCENASTWRLYTSLSDIVAVSGDDYCYLLNNNQDPVPEEMIELLEIDDNSSSSTPTGGPDMNIKYVWVSEPRNGATKRHSMTVEIDEDFYIHVKVTNKGDEEAEDFKIKYYISDDKDFDKDGDTYVNSDRVDSVDAGDSHTDRKTQDRKDTGINIDEPGTYYVWCRIGSLDEDVNTSNDYSRNDDPEEYAKIIVAEPEEFIPYTPKDLTQDQINAAMSAIVNFMLNGEK